MTARPPARSLSRGEARRCLYELDQHALGGARMNEADVVPCRTFPDPARRHLQSLRLEPRHCGGEIVDPQADVVEPRLVHLRRLRRVDRLHEIDLDAREVEDVLVDVLALAAI